LLYKFTCGHVGRDSEPPAGRSRAKTTAFIRVAELRNEKAEDVEKPCPNCKGRTERSS
jgi:hypothetical protein